MRAMVFTEPGRVEMLDVPEPEPRPGETVIDVAACGICGSELHGIAKPGFRQPPLVMGHELAGTTVDGRRVVVNPIVACGTCGHCQRKRVHLCGSRALVGIHRAGGFAERVSVPDELLVELPDDLDFHRAALIEPLANAVHAWNLAGSPTKERVAVLGSGSIGLVCQLIAQASECEVATVDVSEERRGHSAALGAQTTAETLDGEYIAIIDAVGVPATRRASIDHLQAGGTAVWVGLNSPDVSFDAQSLVRTEKTIAGSFAYDRLEFRQAVELARTVNLGWATPMPLEDGADMFMQLMGGRTDVIKAVLCP